MEVQTDLAYLVYDNSNHVTSDFLYFLLTFNYFLGFSSINSEYSMQNTPTFIIGYSFIWSNYKNRVAFANNIINSTDYFDNLILIDITFALNCK